MNLSAVTIQAEAEAEILDAYWYYEGKAEGLGTDFRMSVKMCLDLAARHPQAHPIVEDKVRRALLSRFP